MKLYIFAGSQNSRKPMAIARYLGLDVELESPAPGTHRSPEYMARNPNGKLPVLEDDGFYLWESNAIATYLADKDPEGKLIPADPKVRAEMDQWMFWQTAHFGPAVGKVSYERLLKPMFGQVGDEAAAEKGAAEAQGLAKILDARLADRDFLCGALSVADFAVGPVVETALDASIDLSAFKNLGMWLGRLRELRGWTEVHPKA